MRTTLTIDDDVAKQIERIRKERGLRMRELINDALRVGLATLEAPERPRRRHRTKPVSLGGALISNVDDVSELLAVAEGDEFR